MKRILILFLIIILFPNCLIIPRSSAHREVIGKAQSQFKIGSTTRIEVIALLGYPDAAKGRFILYRHKEYSGGADWGLLFPTGPVGVVGQVYMDLYFEFDKDGVLTDFRTNKYDKNFKSVD